MNSKLEKIEKNTALLKIEVDREQFEKGIQRAYKKNVKRFNIPGFRKGKAPRPIIERHYGEGIFYEDAINEVCPRAYQQAVEEHGLQPVDQPEIDIIQIEKDKPFIFEAVVTVKPEVNLGNYKGIQVEKKEYPVTGEDVDKELENMRNMNARLVTTEQEPAENEDMLIIDYKGYIEGEQFEGGTADNHTLVLGSGQFIEGFEKQLLGAKAGDNVEVNVTFPEYYRAEHLAGKEAVFQVEVKEVKKKELPALDDEFVKDISEFDSLEELKKDIKEKLEKKAIQKADNELEEELIKKVTENTTIDIPEIMIEKQKDIIIRDFEIQLMYQGIKLDDYLTYVGQGLEEFRDSFNEGAGKRVKTQLTLEKIAKIEGITETEEELNKEVEELSKMYKRDDIEEFRNTLGESELNYIKDNIIVKKTVNFLIENAAIK